MALTGWLIEHQRDYNPRSPYYDTTRNNRIFDTTHCSIIGGQLYYIYNDGTEYYYEWNKSTLSQADNNGTNASVIIDYVGVVEEFSNYAFDGCASLQSIDMPICRYIGYSAFRYCSSLQTVNFPSCQYVSGSAFYHCASLQSIDMPICSYIGTDAFNGCSSLQTVNIPSCRIVGTDGFVYCDLLQSIDLPICSSIGPHGFAGCESLQTISLPICNYIGSNAFYRCFSLQTISLPMCSDIYSYAFCSCSNLKDIYLGYSKSVCHFYTPSTVFSGCPSDLKIHVPSSLYGRYTYSYEGVRTSTYPRGSILLSKMFVSDL